MYILVKSDGDLMLQDCDNMRALAIVLEVNDAPVTRLAEIGSTADNRNYWLDADAVVEFSGRKHDQQWLSADPVGLRQPDQFGDFENG